jgi:hypothetical protein
MPHPPSIEVDAILISKLAPMAAAAGVLLPTGPVHFAPELCIQQPISALAIELGRWCHQKDIFLTAARQIVTIDPTTGLLDPMPPERFGSWIETFVTTFRYTGKAKEDTTLSSEDARKILASDPFRQHLRHLVGVNPIRLPALHPDTGELRLLPPGYDPPTYTYTLRHSLEYPLDWTLAQANTFAESLLAEFPWSEDPDPELAEQRDTLTETHFPAGTTVAAALGLSPDGASTRRSAAVSWALTIGTYTRLFFPPCTPRPMALYLANQPGSGKTRLAQIALAPVFGMPYESDLPTNDDEMGKVLSTEAMNFSPYVFFDDIGRGLYSNKLNRFITAAGHTGRIMGGQQKFQVPNVSQVFATGNWVRLSPDLQRRTLAAELFLPGDVSGRKFEGATLTTALLSSDQWRRDCLAACWATLKHWHTTCSAPIARNERPSFEHYTSIIGGILTSAGWTDPLAEPQLDTGGDVNTQQITEFIQRLGAHVIADHWPDTPAPTAAEPHPQRADQHEHTFSRQTLTELARQWELMEWLVGVEGDPDLKAGEARKFGAALKDWRGREITLTCPRTYTHQATTDKGIITTATEPWHFEITFGRRHSNRGSSYPLAITALRPA